MIDHLGDIAAILEDSSSRKQTSINFNALMMRIGEMVKDSANVLSIQVEKFMRQESIEQRIN